MGVSTGLPENTLTYLKAKLQTLKEREKMVTILIDEVFSSSRVEYFNGQYFGTNGDSVTKKLCCFMLKSVCSRYCDVVAMYPEVNLDSVKLKTELMTVLEAVSELGFKVVAISVDNATANRKLYSDLCGGKITNSIPNPVDKNKELFLLFDATHCFKNIFSNFINRKSFLMPGFSDKNQEFAAKLEDIEDIYNSELSKPAKMAY